MAKILGGKEVTESLNRELLKRSELLINDGITPCLAIVRVGERPDDLAYERSAVLRAEKTGILVKKFVFPNEIRQEELAAEIVKINNDDELHGVLIFRPMPSRIDDELIRNTLDPSKDIDGITDVSQAGVYAGSSKGYPPCTAEACMEIIHHYGIELRGKNVAVIGRSQVIGKPVAMMLIRENATVTVCHTKTVNIADICKDKDMIIAAAGSIGMVTKDFLHEGQIVIDVAVNFDENGKMKGDVVFEDAEPIVDAITPVPGGVGGVTTGILMKHCIEAAEKRK